MYALLLRGEERDIEEIKIDKEIDGDKRVCERDRSKRIQWGWTGTQWGLTGKQWGLTGTKIFLRFLVLPPAIHFVTVLHFPFLILPINVALSKIATVVAKKDFIYIVILPKIHADCCKGKPWEYIIMLKGSKHFSKGKGTSWIK